MPEKAHFLHFLLSCPQNPHGFGYNGIVLLDLGAFNMLSFDSIGAMQTICRWMQFCCVQFRLNPLSRFCPNKQLILYSVRIINEGRNQ